MTKIIHNCMNDTTANHCRWHRNDDYQNYKKNCLNNTVKYCLKKKFSTNVKILKDPIIIRTTNIYLEK